MDLFGYYDTFLRINYWGDITKSNPKQAVGKIFELFKPPDLCFRIRNDLDISIKDFKIR